ncbi:MAG: hypothetical protein KF819_02210 [Labilithrix sp.]|nr:hypothetical protein [Labilithrix sp.]
MSRRFVWALALAALAARGTSGAAPPRAEPRDPPRVFFGADGWRDAGHDAVRGVTIGPIENAYHPGVGYGSEAYGRTLDECVRAGAGWVAITPFGRVGDLAGRGVDPSFEQPFEKNRDDVRRAIEMAHARGLAVMLVPHLWVESGEWRAKIDPPTDAAWGAWTESYGAFVRGWAEVAAVAGVDLFSVGVELRSWVTTTRAPSFAALVRSIRAIYKGPLTYSGNWDDVEDTVVLGELDVIGVNAFYPLADKDGASFDALLEGGRRVRDRVRRLADTWQKPVLFTEIGYTTRRDPAIRPWEWPDDMKHVRVDERAQADAYRALLAPLLDEPRFMGFFVWRVYADPDDVSQEAEWGFSPRGKLAELVVRDAFATRWASDTTRRWGWAPAARVPGLLPWAALR